VGTARDDPVANELEHDGPLSWMDRTLAVAGARLPFDREPSAFPVRTVGES
jgi:hypothetical protein